MCNFSESIFRDGEKSSKKADIRIVYRTLAKGMSVPDIVDIADVDGFFADAIIHAAGGSLSTDETNVERIYGAMYLQQPGA